MTEQTGERHHDHELDPVIVDAVQHVANRFGVSGLEDLITEAERELTGARQALTELGGASAAPAGSRDDVP